MAWTGPGPDRNSSWACILCSRSRGEFTGCTRGRRQEDKLDCKSDYPRIYIQYIQAWVTVLTKHMSRYEWLMCWHILIMNSLSYCADWCTVIEAYYKLMHCPINRTGWLILSNIAYPSALLCSNQSKWVTCLLPLIVQVSWKSCEVSHNHVM